MSVLAAVLGVLVAATPALAIDTPDALGPCGPIARRHEHVELTASQLRKLGRPTLERMGVLAMRDGRATPIPFQVDERAGRTIAMTDGEEPSEDDRPGIFDYDDVVVFLPCDAGTRATPEALQAAAPSPIAAWREVRLTDPIDGSEGFAYVVVGDPPPRTGRHYVAYEPRADLVSTALYRIGMVQALPNYFAIAMSGPLGPNLLDGLRLRAEATMLGDLLHWGVDEGDLIHELIAWKAGPVRVVRRSRHDLNLLGLGIRLTAGVANTSFYPLHLFGPGSLKLPISPGLLFTRITAMGGVDLRDLRGWRFVAPGGPPEGLAIDGVMDPAERAFAADGTWFVLVHEREAMLVTITLSENLARAIPFGIVYRDDAQRPEPPERERGSVPLVGYRGRGIERLPADRYRFDLRVYLLPGYRPGDAERVLAERDRPLGVEVSGPAARAAAPASGR